MVEHVQQHSATLCNTLQHTTHRYQWDGKTRPATPCSTRQHPATLCNTLHHATHRCQWDGGARRATQCNTAQHSATHYAPLAVRWWSTSSTPPGMHAVWMPASASSRAACVSHGTHMPRRKKRYEASESWHTYDCDMSHEWMPASASFRAAWVSRGTLVVAHVWMRHVTRMNARLRQFARCMRRVTAHL